MPDRGELRRRSQELLADVEHVVETDPAGPEAQAIAGRWVELLQELAGSAAALDAQLVKSAGLLGLCCPDARQRHPGRTSLGVRRKGARRAQPRRRRRAEFRAGNDGLGPLSTSSTFWNRSACENGFNRKG